MPHVRSLRLIYEPRYIQSRDGGVSMTLDVRIEVNGCVFGCTHALTQDDMKSRFDELFDRMREDARRIICEDKTIADVHPQARECCPPR